MQFVFAIWVRFRIDDESRLCSLHHSMHRSWSAKSRDSFHKFKVSWAAAILVSNSQFNEREGLTSTKIFILQ